MIKIHHAIFFLETTEVTKKKKEGSALKKELDKDPIPAPIIKEISDLLKITSSNDQSSKIAEELRQRKKCKKGDYHFEKGGILFAL